MIGFMLIIQICLGLQVDLFLSSDLWPIGIHITLQVHVSLAHAKTVWIIGLDLSLSNMIFIKLIEASTANRMLYGCNTRKGVIEVN